MRSVNPADGGVGPVHRGLPRATARGKVGHMVSRTPPAAKPETEHADLLLAEPAWAPPCPPAQEAIGGSCSLERLERTGPRTSAPDTLVAADLDPTRPGRARGAAR
jgi:hypothetical protein